MKTKKIIFVSLIALSLAALIFSCENPIGLGKQLDIEGPVVAFTSPVARKAVLTHFEIKGTASDTSGIKKLLLKAERNNEPYAKQWQYNNGKWEISQDGGKTWSNFSGVSPKEPKENSFEWTIFVDMAVGGADVPDGEYLFILQAWDTGGFTDDNSYKTRVLIIDNDLPKVDISNPPIYTYETYESGKFTGTSGLQALHEISDNGIERFDPSNIGKFLTQSFQLQWQIVDEHDVWSIDLRFYKHDVEIDDEENTDLPNNYVYRYFKNDLVPPVIPQPENNIKPNGNVTVPDLSGPSISGFYDGGTWDLKTPITEKTTIKVVAACYDAAGHPSQEKTLGYFVYWPLADYPWIEYTDGMENFDKYVKSNGEPKDNFEDVFMIYPGRKIKSNAFHAHGLKEVKFSLYDVITEVDANGNIIKLTVADEPRDDKDKNGNLIYKDIEISNNMRPDGSFSTVFPWEFTPPPRSGYYVVKATAKSEYKESELKEALFRVQDISFPDFITPPKPAATEQLFKFVSRDNGDETGNAPVNNIRISGTVSDATNVTSLTMVWINPESEGFAAMSQLSYFRDQSYDGWKEALEIETLNTSKFETPGYNPKNSKYPFDPNGHYNRLWNLELTEAGIDYDTNRKLFTYSVNIPLNLLSIGPNEGQQPLKSQVFLLRVENPDKKCTIITYAPQGDTLTPTIRIINVDVNGKTFTPNDSQVMERFVGGETITVNGTWEEDSVEYLPIETYFNNLKVNVNGKLLSVTNPLPKTIGKEGEGTWQATIDVVSGAAGAGEISKNDLSDTFVVSADVKDIGGNTAEAGTAWLIQSDNLRLMRISSDTQDGTYNAGQTIRIFLEFNKAVQLTNSGIPALTLNTGATAAYDTNSGINTRQYFNYTVGSNHSTTPGYLNVIGLSNPGTWSADNYQFTWHKESNSSGPREEIRITNTAVSSPDGDKPAGYDNFYTKKIPTSTSDNAEYPFTLVAGKNIEIDTAAPQVAKDNNGVVNGITTSNTTGYYGLDSEIYITVKFNKPVKIGTGAATPRLTLAVTTGAQTTVQTDGNSVRVNGNEVTFVYRVVQNNVAVSGTGIVITNHTGSITDLAGTPFADNGISSITEANRTLTGRYIDTIAPTHPRIQIVNSSNTQINNTVSGSTRNGTSNTAGGVSWDSETPHPNMVNLANVYDNVVKIQVTPYGNIDEDYSKLEYSTNNGRDWVPFTVINGTTVYRADVPLNGSYTVTARQTDAAGNTSHWTVPIGFTWDPGHLVSRISSTSANGTYTHVAGRNSINVTVYFRKAVTISGTPSIELNARRNNANITVNTSTTGTDSRSFTYTVLNNDAMLTANTLLDVLSLSGFTATDSAGVNVSSYLNITAANMPAVAAAAGSGFRLNESKEIKVETGDLTRQSISFVDGVGDGIRTDDGSYWTTLEIEFNHTINKGSGNITIEQIRGSGNTAYRLPTVLTETQYDRFRGIANFNNYYTKGTNGHNSAGTADTSAKYILGYDIDTAEAANQPDAANSTPIKQFAEAFRKAEGISINVNSAAVTVINGTTLKVKLSGSSAPQVPGVTYAVKYPAGLVNDNLGNESKASDGSNFTQMDDTQPNPVTAVNVNLGGVAKPFIRIKKTQDTIGARVTGNATTPTLTATQPTLAYVRMDSRTPGSAIRYTTSTQEHSVTGQNWTLTGGPDAGSTVTIPSEPVTTSTQYSNPETIGGGAVAAFGGYKWWVRAKAFKGGDSSENSHEIAYRTAITYQARGPGGGAMATSPTTTGQQTLQDGDQIWIRGGDAIGSSSIPGFPFTWEDDFNSLRDNKKRAGIRLMTKTTAGDNLTNSTWRFQTWDLNATAYVGFTRGCDGGTAVSTATTTTLGNAAGVQVTYNLSSPNEAWQYGPRWFAAQRGGWSTSHQVQYRVIPGEHRWVDIGGNGVTAADPINFPQGFDGRPNAMTTSITTNLNSN